MMTTNQLPSASAATAAVTTLGWAGSTVKDRHLQEARHLGQSDALPDLPPLRRGAVPMGGRASQVPAHPVATASPATQIKDKNAWR